MSTNEKGRGAQAPPPRGGGCSSPAVTTCWPSSGDDRQDAVDGGPLQRIVEELLDAAEGVVALGIGGRRVEPAAHLHGADVPELRDQQREVAGRAHPARPAGLA